MRWAFPAVGVCFAILLMPLLPGQAAKAFFSDNRAEATRESAERVRLEKLRSSVGDRAFAAQAIARWQVIVLLHPRSHPLFAELSHRPGTPEYEFVTHQPYYGASPEVLARTHDRAALPVLKQAVMLRNLHTQGTAGNDYFDYFLGSSLAAAYLEIALYQQPPEERMSVLADYLEWNPQDGPFEDALSKQENLGPLLVRYLRSSYPYCAARRNGAPADLMRMGSLVAKSRSIGVTSGQLVALTDPGNPRDTRYVGVIALAYRGDRDGALRRALTREFEAVLNQFAQPAITESARGRQDRLDTAVALLYRAIEARPLPTFKTLVLRSRRWTLYPLFGSLTRALKFQPEDFAALVALARDPATPDPQRAVILKALVNLNIPAAKPLVIDFVHRLGLNPVGHENESARQFYPDLGLDSLDVQNWLHWAQRNSSTQEPK